MVLAVVERMVVMAMAVGTTVKKEVRMEVGLVRRGEIRCPAGLAIWRSENAPILNIIYPP